MSKETTVKYWCDYTGTTSRHPATIGVKIVGSSELPADTEDTCLAHMCQMVTDLLRTDPTVRLEVKVLDATAPLEPVTVDKKYGPCTTCGRTLGSSGGWRQHIKSHPQEWVTA